MASVTPEQARPGPTDSLRGRAYSRILVPVDGSKFAEAALRPAVLLAAQAGASVHLVAVVPGGAARPAGDADDPSTEADLETKHERESYLRSLKVRLAAESDCPLFTTVIPDMHPAHALADHAVQIAADLIVAATHSKGLVTRALVGSTAVDLVRRAPCPVLLVPSSDPEFDPASTPLQEAPTSVIAALDPSGDSDDVVLGHAWTVANQWKGSLHLVEVLLPPPIPTVTGAGMPVATVHETPPSMERAERQAGERLAEIATDLTRRGIDATPHVLFGSRAADAICDLARSVDADLVVVGRHDKGFLERVALGSESDRLARQARSVGLLICPLDGGGEAGERATT